MPRKWQQHWPAQGVDEEERDRLIHTLGNLTLLTGKLNSTVSNGSWLGINGKRAGLEGHDVLILNRDLLKKGSSEWTDATIRERTQELVRLIAEIWPVPPNHRSGFAATRQRSLRKVELTDLINAGLLQPGMSLVPKRKKFSHRVATLLADGRVEVDSQPFATAREAANAIYGKRTGGWWFFMTDPTSGRTLRDVRREYIESMAVDSDEDDQDDDGDDDEV